MAKKKNNWALWIGIVVVILGVASGIFYVVNGRDNSIIPIKSGACPSDYSLVICSTDSSYSMYGSPYTINNTNYYVVAGDVRGWVYPSKVYDYCASLIKSNHNDNRFCAKVFTVINGEVRY